MNYDGLKKVEKTYSEWLKTQPFFHSTKVDKNENGKTVLWIYYKNGMSHKTKREIATELGDIPLKFSIQP